MKKIPSFTIDHIRLLRGIYVSRKDEVNGEIITTFDIRMKEPNREPALAQGALHTIEHLAATYLRNEPQWKDKIIYWGPMGCLTGNYLLMMFYTSVTGWMLYYFLKFVNLFFKEFFVFNIGKMSKNSF